MVLQCAFVRYSDVCITDIGMYEIRIVQCIRLKYFLVKRWIVLCMTIEHCVVYKDDLAKVDKTHIDVQLNTLIESMIVYVDN